MEKNRSSYENMLLGSRKKYSEEDKQEEWDELGEDNSADNYEKPSQKEIFQYLEKIGTVGYETQDWIGKSFFDQSNAILTIISIFSLIVLYIISFEIFSLEKMDKLYFMAAAYIPLFLSMSCAIGVQFLSKT